MKLTDLEFSICEVSDSLNQFNYIYFFNNKLKISKILKVIFNRIIRKYGGVNLNLSLLKLYGLHVGYIFMRLKFFNNKIIVYKMSIPFYSLYFIPFYEILQLKLPTNEFEVKLMLQSIPVLLKFKVCFILK